MRGLASVFWTMYVLGTAKTLLPKLDWMNSMEESEKSNIFTNLATIYNLNVAYFLIKRNLLKIWAILRRWRKRAKENERKGARKRGWNGKI